MALMLSSFGSLDLTGNIKNSVLSEIDRESHGSFLLPMVCLDSGKYRCTGYTILAGCCCFGFVLGFFFWGLTPLGSKSHLPVWNTDYVVNETVRIYTITKIKVLYHNKDKSPHEYNSSELPGFSFLYILLLTLVSIAKAPLLVLDYLHQVKLGSQLSINL